MCGEVVSKKGDDSKTKTERLQIFVRSVSTSDCILYCIVQSWIFPSSRSVCCKSTEPNKVWEILLNSPAKSLATQQVRDLTVYVQTDKPAEKALYCSSKNFPWQIACLVVHVWSLLTKLRG